MQYSFEKGKSERAPISKLYAGKPFVILILNKWRKRNLRPLVHNKYRS